MAFHVIKGTFHIRGYSPDGDSIRFAADDETNWELLSGPPVRLNGRRHAQLRLEGIDTLETHFMNVRQPPDLATKALDFLLREVGITGVEWDVLMTRVVAANDGTSGYIVSRAAEENGRPIAFVFAGPPAEGDGDPLFLTPERLELSLNYKSVLEGLAYPTFYQGLFADLRAKLAEASLTARGAALNIWSEDRTNAGFDVPDLLAITDRHVILPKLFRRIAEYMTGGGQIAGFKQYLEARQEGVTIVNTAHFTHFDTVIDVTGDVVTMTELPENLMFEG